jgi:asparagine synthase (glutamine-hydrolysing)
MCGIAGKFLFDASDTVARETVDAMTDTLVHRGPDEAGYLNAPGVGLGMRRLSIIDLSTGNQPVESEGGVCAVVFNGEIYNFRALRATLEAAGHRFRTRTDTEVIVHGYEQWGDRVVERLRGMFAFALFDRRSHRLLLARDRAGIKPLYYAELPGRGVVFASEIKAILEDREVPRAWRPEALHAFLALQYVPAPATIYAAVQKLPAGHYLVADRTGVRVEQYWDLTFNGDGDPRREAEYLERLDALLRESIALHMVSDVPLGAFLSGGIDSSTVVAYMTEATAAPVVTSSLGFKETRYDELKPAALVARHLGTHHFSRIAEPRIEDLLPRLAWHFDEPFADASAVPTLLVSAVAREHVTVALSGDGGDELWAGYSRHRVERHEARARRVLGRMSAFAGRLGACLPLAVKGVRALRHLALGTDEACARKHNYDLFEPQPRLPLYTVDFLRAVQGVDPFAAHRAAYRACPSLDPVDRALYVDFKTYLADDILAKVDRTSMAVSLEARVPLLDHELLEFAATVPSSLKLRGRVPKYLLRRLLEPRVPPAIVERGKHGFELPRGEWLRGPLAPMARDLLFDGRMTQRGIFERRAVESLWHEHAERRGEHADRLWTLVMLELWFRQFIDAGASRPSALSATAIAGTVREAA